MSDDMIFDCFTCDAVDKISEQETEITRLRAELAAVTAERDALAARLAPVEDEALVEIAVKEVEKVIASANDSETVGGARWKALRAAIAAIRPHIEAAAVRGRESKDYEALVQERANQAACAFAAAIRSGK